MMKYVRISFLTVMTGFLFACGASGVEEKEPTSNGTSSAAGISSLAASSISSSAASSISSRAASSTVSQSSSDSLKQVTLQWAHPQLRENGDYLELSEIGGYEIRVFNPTTSNYTSFQVAGNSTNSYVIKNYLSNMTIEIAVYDTQGLYSQFVPVTN